MPDRFPPTLQGWSGIWAKALIVKPPGFVAAPNTGNPNFAFTSDTLKGGIAKRPERPTSYGPGAAKFVSPAPPLRPNYFFDARVAWENRGILRWRLIGTTRDSAGTAIAGVPLRLYRIDDGVISLQNEFTSSAVDGTFTYDVTAGPYWLVAYKFGSPDKSGTSLKTLTGAVAMPFP